MTYQSKTDWKYDDIVKETDLNRIEQGIHDAHVELDKVPSVPITLKSGLQTITANRDTPLRITNIRGRTIINLLGREGNFYNGAKWLSFAGSTAVNNNTATITGNGTAINPQIWTNHIGPTPSLGDKYFLRATMRARSSLCTRLRLYLWSSPTEKLGEGYQANPVIDKEYEIGSLLTVTQDIIDNWNDLSLRLVAQYGTVEDSKNAVAEFSEAMLIKIPSEDGNLTIKQLLEKYPYVESLQNVNAVYVENTGGNLVSTDRTAWKQGTLDITTGTEAASTFNLRSEFVDVLPNTKYTISVQNGDIGVFQYSDSEFLSNIALTPSKVTFTTSAMTTRIRFILRIDDNTTVLTPNDILMFSPMLTIGSELKPFQFQRKSYMYLPTCQLSANPDGSFADRMYMDNEGKPRVVRHWKRITLDGLKVASSSIRTGYKVIAIDVDKSFMFGKSFSVLVKHDGSFPTHIEQAASSAFSGANQYFINRENIRITIDNSDSGWGQNYNPLPEEVMAYFYGWKMYNGNAGNTTYPYDGDSDQSKAWCRIGDNGGGTNSLPTMLSPRVGSWGGPYLIQYQLDTPIDEPLQHEGCLMLYEGINQVDVGTGIVAREKANPVKWSDKYNINNWSNGQEKSRTKYRIKHIKNIYRNENVDNLWNCHDVVTNNGYGGVIAQCDPQNFDPSAVYQVTYLALDTYKIGITPTEINAEYAPNLRGMVESLVEENKNALARITVLENEKAMKVLGPSQWIAPTLLNGWTVYTGAGYSGVVYYKDSLGSVEIDGVIQAGTKVNGTPIFYLPVGYRPLQKINRNISAFDTTGAPTWSHIVIDTDGKVTIYNASDRAVIALRFATK